MDKNGVNYEELDVGENKKSRDDMISKSKQMSVPVIEIDGEILTGFNEEQLKEKLGL